MKRLAYMPLQWTLQGIALLPFWVLYRMSDVMFVLIYYVVRYRRKVALANIVSSFPDKSAKECRQICRRFYRHFADYFFETIKLPRISDYEMRRRMVIKNIDEVDRLFAEGRSIAMLFSHCGNWEWAPSITLWSRFKPGPDTVYAQVYRRLDNEWFDNYFLKLRSRFGSVSFEKKMVLRHLLDLRRRGVKSITGFMSDQKPSHGDPTHILKFLNHPTAMITGTETLARKLDLAVLYWDVEKPSRGHYVLTTRHIADHPAELPDHAVTDIYARMLQATIERTPHIWLWTHNRWKKPVTLPDEPVVAPQEGEQK